VLLGGGRCVKVAVKLRAFVAFPFDACRWYDAHGTGVLRGQIVHYGGVWLLARNSSESGGLL